MKKKLMLGVIAAVTLFATLPALADYYVVRQGTTGPCAVVEQRPTTMGTVVVAGDRNFATRDDAQQHMAALCNNN